MAIRWPTVEEKSTAADWIVEETCPAWRPGFAMVDGTLIPLHAKPGHFGEQFFDRKSNYSLNLQVTWTSSYTKLILADYSTVNYSP
jgi:hypothetical protein